MSWSVGFQVKDGKVDLESIVTVGNVPEGPVAINGHQPSGEDSTWAFLSVSFAGFATSSSYQTQKL